MKFDLIIIKDDAFNLNFKNINQKEISIGEIIKSELIRGETITLTIVDDKKMEIKLSFCDKFNNKYQQIISITPPRIKNGQVNGFLVKISKRNWRKFFFNNILLKYFK